MADIKISQLGSAIAVGDTDVLPIVSGGNTLKATAAQVKEHSVGNTNISGIGDGSVTGAISSLNSGKQPKTLDTPLTIGGVSKTTVEDALGGLVSENQTLKNGEQATRDSIAPTEDGTNYAHSYSKGAQFYHNGVLRKVTASSVNTSSVISSTSVAVDNITTQIQNPFLVASETIAANNSYGDVTFAKYSNGMKKVTFSSSTVPSSATGICTVPSGYAPIGGTVYTTGSTNADSLRLVAIGTNAITAYVSNDNGLYIGINYL